MRDTEDDSAPITEDRWLSRIDEVDGIRVEEVSAVHGRLIAHGFLKFQLSGRDGLVYQLTSLGRRGARLADENDDEDANELLHDDALEEAAYGVS